ncbi:hypothetical protein [Paenibacillus terrigena]|nr:hypothetical protein [Paenibacillus terrigena]
MKIKKWWCFGLSEVEFRIFTKDDMLKLGDLKQTGSERHVNAIS